MTRSLGYWLPGCISAAKLSAVISNLSMCGFLTTPWPGYRPKCCACFLTCQVKSDIMCFIAMGIVL